jgi:hypothetical protein
MLLDARLPLVNQRVLSYFYLSRDIGAFFDTLRRAVFSRSNLYGRAQRKVR